MSNPFDSTELPGPRRVLVLGDIMLDQYTWGRAERVSPEAPVLVMQAETCDVRLGGAGAVAGLLRGLDAEVLLAGVVGDDPEGRMVRRLLDEAGIDGRMVLTDADRPTTHKQRFLATVEQRQPHQILRVDHERTHPLAPELAESLAGAIEHELPNVDAVLISDYAKGVCTPELLARVIGAAGAGTAGLGRSGADRRLRAVSRSDAGQAEPARDGTGHGAGDPLAGGCPGGRPGTGAAVRFPGRGRDAGRRRAWCWSTADGTAGTCADAAAPGVPISRARATWRWRCWDCALAESRKVEESKESKSREQSRGLVSAIGLREAVELANVAAGLEVERVGVVPVTRREIAEAAGLGVGPGRRTGPSDAVRPRGTPDSRPAAGIYQSRDAGRNGRLGGGVPARGQDGRVHQRLLRPAARRARDVPGRSGRRWATCWWWRSTATRASGGWEKAPNGRSSPKPTARPCSPLWLRRPCADLRRGHAAPAAGGHPPRRAGQRRHVHGRPGRGPRNRRTLRRPSVRDRHAAGRVDDEVGRGNPEESQSRGESRVQGGGSSAVRIATVRSGY